MSFFNTGIEALWSQDGTSAYLQMVITWRSDVYHQLEVDYADIEDRKILGIGAFVNMLCFQELDHKRNPDV